MHKSLQIVHIGEKCVQALVKKVLASWQQIVREDLQQIPEVLVPMEAYPMHLVIQYKA